MDITDMVTFEKKVILIILYLAIYQQYVEGFFIVSNTHHIIYTRRFGSYCLLPQTNLRR